jgi:hypothetical protein
MRKILFALWLTGLFPLLAADPSPETAELLANKQFQPAEVTLQKACKFDVLAGGKKSGEVTVPAGRTVQCHAVKGQNLEVRVGNSEATVPLADTDYVSRAIALKQEWNQKSLAEKRAKLIADSPKSASTEPVKTAPEETKPEPVKALPGTSSEPAGGPASGSKGNDDKEIEKIAGNNPEKKKLLRFLTARPFKCVENGAQVAVSTFRPDGTYILGNGYEGKWKLDNNGDLITYCYASGKSRINRYVFEERFNKFAGQRDRKSDIQDKAVLYMAPQ